MNQEKIDWKKGNGLLPTIIQEEKNREVLMLAYSTKESLEKAFQTKQGWYYSRSRKKLWRKGETSGNTQKLKKVFVDCDKDTLLFKVEQKGNACHLNKKNCFEEIK
ncbi:MAG: phosphoribosyl-AMP cyclohydrolase [Candidatus Diapherotrites archaeon CG10_big_fil_rev_8_21_14_0_10_31_34]|nr:MAG: phosphoribosyl-AMP cyclohydrolase [Candidatus Diapherotrites archaeon CG10_big_fil_rev_8_21_14_0_10_31_34]